MPNFVGDNECDDENNYESCDWDGGDCCGKNVNTTYCSACECLDPKAPICRSPDNFGDNYCDDNNNNKLCHWDGGDCCGNNVNTTYCIDCECLDPNIQSSNASTTASCRSPNHFGDNHCDDNNNNESCNWDGGDCCGNNVNTSYCIVCECLDPNAQNIKTSTTASLLKSCRSPKHFGDNYCDDNNNNESCDWDGGDCCGDDVNTTYCSLCKCLDPNAISKQPQISNGTNSKLLSNAISSGIKRTSNIR